MQSEQKKDSPETEDPFTILKNHRKKFIRPKCKYVRKVPLLPRIQKTKSLPKLAQIMEYKNQRKMTADSEIEMLLNEQPMETVTEIKIDPVKIETQEDGFFEEMMELDFVLPLEEQEYGQGKFMMSGTGNRQYIDFFGEE